MLVWIIYVYSPFGWFVRWWLFHINIRTSVMICSSAPPSESYEAVSGACRTLSHTYTHTHHLASPRLCHFSIKVCKAEGMLRQQGLALHRARLSEERCVLPSATNKTWWRYPVEGDSCLLSVFYFFSGDRFGTRNSVFRSVHKHLPRLTVRVGCGRVCVTARSPPLRGLLRGHWRVGHCFVRVEYTCMIDK